MGKVSPISECTNRIFDGPASTIGTEGWILCKYIHPHLIFRHNWIFVFITFLSIDLKLSRSCEITCVFPKTINNLYSLTTVANQVSSARSFM